MAGTGRASSWRYSRWDGSQEPFAVEAEDVLAGVADDLLYHGDLDAALRRVLQQGFTTPSGQRVPGLRDLLDRIQARREELLGTNDLSGLYEDARQRLDELLDTERAAVDQAAAARPGDEDAARRAAEAHTALDLLPSGLAGRLGALSEYDFASAAARAQYEQLVADLRRDLTQLQLDRAAGAMAAAGPQERAHLRAGLDALNRMLEQRAAGEPVDPSFAQFMAEFGDLFPEAKSLDELLERMARRMAAASALLASMTPEQRAELAALADELMSDMDLAWQLDRLGTNLRDALPSLTWDRGAQMTGDHPLGLAEAGDVFGELAELDQLGQMLRSATQPGELAEVDPDEVAQLLGPDAAAELERLASLTKRLEDEGLVARREGRLTMTPKGLRRLGSRALDELFSRLRRDRIGEHPTGIAGVGHDRSEETKSYEYGDPLRLDVEKTLRNTLLRSASSSGAGSGDAADEAGAGRAAARFPLRLTPDDFEIERSEHLSASSTVLAVDLSLSMPMRDNFLAAKKVAIALQSLIASRFPRDYLGLVGFSATAREIQPRELPEVSWDFAYGTNLQHALALSRRMLAGRPGARQVIVITDGEPTAHVLDGGEVFFDYPPTPETIRATLGEVARCTRAGIAINTFVLDATGGLRAFVEQMTKMNRGRAFFTTPDELGGYVLVDFVEHRAPRTRRVASGS